MKIKHKWDVKKYPSLSDFIIRLFDKGLDRDEAYWAVANQVLLDNNDSRQAIADRIAQLDSMNVFAKGRIPKREVA